MRAQAIILASLTSFWVASATECWDDPEIDLCDHATDLNNGEWALKDINWYRRSVTRANTANLQELMNMNETNETELLLVTPLSEAPTPMPPTPAPTPIPQDVVTTQSFGEIASAANFVSNNVAGALIDGLVGATYETTFEIGVQASVDPVPTEPQCKATYAIVMSLTESLITCSSPTYRRLDASGRHLQAGTISVTGRTTDAAAADVAKAAAGDDTQLKAALATVDSTKFANVVAAAQTPTLAAETKVTQQAADPEEAAAMAAATQAKVSENQASAATVAGVDVSTLSQPKVEVEQVPTPMPTKVPTNMPTALPAGFTNSPTKNPTYMPTKSPTAMPTKSPTAMPTAMPTKMPTAMPTEMPTIPPTKTPTKMPTASPTNSPTKNPTKMPTPVPTPVPPTSAPTMSPTNQTEEESGANLGGAGFLTVAVLAFATLVA